jgi:hypothetical protein
MKLDEYKALIEEQRKQSLADAIAALTKANDALTSTFNVEEE